MHAIILFTLLQIMFAHYLNALTPERLSSGKSGWLWKELIRVSLKKVDCVRRSEQVSKLI